MQTNLQIGLHINWYLFETWCPYPMSFTVWFCCCPLLWKGPKQFKCFDRRKSHGITCFTLVNSLNKKIKSDLRTSVTNKTNVFLIPVCPEKKSENLRKRNSNYTWIKLQLDLVKFVFKGDHFRILSFHKYKNYINVLICLAIALTTHSLMCIQTNTMPHVSIGTCSEAFKCVTTDGNADYNFDQNCTIWALSDNVDK